MGSWYGKQGRGRPQLLWSDDIKGIQAFSGWQCLTISANGKILKQPMFTIGLYVGFRV